MTKVLRRHSKLHWTNSGKFYLVVLIFMQSDRKMANILKRGTFDFRHRLLRSDRPLIMAFDCITTLAQ